MPQFWLGYHGMPRRYPNYPPEFQFLNVMSTAGYTVQLAGFVLISIYLTMSFFTGRKAGPNPWGATGLEWMASSPPITHNFEHTPRIVCGPYEYSLNMTQTGERADVR
jgi:cytochrome c oxidase subunit 1